MLQCFCWSLDIDGNLLLLHLNHHFYSSIVPCWIWLLGYRLNLLLLLWLLKRSNPLGVISSIWQWKLASYSRIVIEDLDCRHYKYMIYRFREFTAFHEGCFTFVGFEHILLRIIGLYNTCYLAIFSRA